MAIISSKQPNPDRASHQSKKQSKAPLEEDALLQPQVTADELGKAEEGVRPRRLADYIGQKDLKDVL
ncbi:MAG: Holliday junction branch migration DNA helicase RuvB, partial [Leptolyngbyaceae cyanobacterium SL_7_1]|nr:Holliday junction branch migration DNA helicase RuvB [Leptolyngbyaceae cyanobacterium SL_7_1]